MSGARRALGLRGEEAARHLAASKGYRVLARGRRTPFGEVDLVLEDRRGALVMAEVKARTARPRGRRAGAGAGAGAALEAGLLAIDPRRRARYRRAALEIAADLGRPDAPIRFDVFAVVDPGDGGGLLVTHVEDAFS